MTIEAANEMATEATNMGIIGTFTLTNKGGFFCNGGASISIGNGKWKDYGYTDSLSDGDTQTYDLSQYGVPDGSVVYLYVNVKAGYNKRASKECFTFQIGNVMTAEYKIYGVTANPNLTYNGLASQQ